MIPPIPPPAVFPVANFLSCLPISCLFDISDISFAVKPIPAIVPAIPNFVPIPMPPLFWFNIAALSFGSLAASANDPPTVLTPPVLIGAIEGFLLPKNPAPEPLPETSPAPCPLNARSIATVEPTPAKFIRTSEELCRTVLCSFKLCVNSSLAINSSETAKTPFSAIAS